MIGLALALKQRFELFLQTKFLTTANASSGDHFLMGPVNSVKYLDVIDFYKYRPKIGIQLASGDVPNIFRRIEKVERDTGKIWLTDPLPVDVPMGSTVQRAPGWQTIKQVIIGGVETVSVFPTLAIVPSGISREWTTISPPGSVDTHEFKILYHIKDDGKEKSWLNILSATQEIDDLLMADLHIRVPTEIGGQPGAAFDSRVTRINFGITEQSVFAKTAQLDWYAKEWLLRTLVSQSGNYDHFMYHPGKAGSPY